MAVLLIACSAVLTGVRSFVAIDEWAADAPQDVLARLGARTATALAVRIPPSGATVRRVIKDTCPGGLADLLGHDPAGTDTLALGQERPRRAPRRHPGRPRARHGRSRGAQPLTGTAPRPSAAAPHGALRAPVRAAYCASPWAVSPAQPT